MEQLCLWPSILGRAGCLWQHFPWICVWWKGWAALVVGEYLSSYKLLLIFPCSHHRLSFPFLLYPTPSLHSQAFISHLSSSDLVSKSPFYSAACLEHNPGFFVSKRLAGVGDHSPVSWSVPVFLKHFCEVFQSSANCVSGGEDLLRLVLGSKNRFGERREAKFKCQWLLLILAGI